MTSTSVASVSVAGAFRTRSSTRVARVPAASSKTMYPTARAATEAMRTAPAATSFASFAFGSKRRRRDVDHALDRRVQHLRDEHERDRKHERDELQARDADRDSGDEDEDRGEEVDAEVPLRPEDMDDPLERVVEAVEQRRRAPRSRLAHAYSASRASISPPWS